jgi:hypothetical protein
MMKSCIFIFYHFFKKLRADGEYQPHLITDQVALLAIYLPVIQDRLKSYILDWNTHDIRPQKAPVIYGKVKDLYERPGPDVLDYKMSFRPDDLLLLQADLIQQHPAIEGFDLDEYLPPQTFEWCQTQLQQLGFDPHRPPPLQANELSTPYRSVYLQLRHHAQLHEQSGNLPILEICEHPVL